MSGLLLNSMEVHERQSFFNEVMEVTQNSFNDQEEEFYIEGTS